MGVKVKKKTGPKRDPWRPPKFKTAKELEDKICEYFLNPPASEFTDVVTAQGIHKLFRPTITGLVLYLGFCDRSSFYDTEKRDGFSYTIKRARTRIENAYEKRGDTFSIFALKNFGWTDKSEIDLDTTVTVNVIKFGEEK
jgi:hypothetical protein